MLIELAIFPIFHGLYSRMQTFDFNISSERPLSKLSENHKLTNGTKVMAVQDALFIIYNTHTYTHTHTQHTHTHRRGQDSAGGSL